MPTVSIDAFARECRRYLQQLRERGEALVVEDGGVEIARVMPAIGPLTASQALADLYGILSPDEGEAWLADARRAADHLDDEIRDPWGY